MQTEIMTNGTVSAWMYIYQDFLTYTGGVYRHTSGNYVTNKRVRILGWGVEDNTPYWLCSNSWGQYWGDTGLFKILLGHNECYIEDYAKYGVPDIHN